MKEFKEFLNESKSPYKDKDIDNFFKNAGLLNMNQDVHSYVYGGYSSKTHSHIYGLVWDDNENEFYNDAGYKQSYAVNIVWIYLNSKGIIEADVSPMPSVEKVVLNTAEKIAAQVAKKEANK